MINLFSIILFAFLFVFSLTKPLTKEIIQFIDEDQHIFDNYREDFKDLSCLTAVYSKLKHIYEKELIDDHIKKVDNKKAFLDELQAQMYNKCTSSKDVGQVQLNKIGSIQSKFVH